MTRKLTIVAIYTTDEYEAKEALKEKGKYDNEKVEKIVLCKDTEDVVYIFIFINFIIFYYFLYLLK